MIPMRMATGFFIFCLAIFQSYASSQDSQKIQFQFDLQDLDGQRQVLLQYDSQVSRAFVFLSTTCPISNSYIPELNRLAIALPQGVLLYGVVSEPNTTRAGASNHFEE